ncbi:MAG: hypothetical protein R3C18_15735 [Planctomycetaceae bacterium]
MSDSAPPPSEDPPQRSGWWWKIPVSLWVMYHVFAMFIGPASIPPASPTVQACWPAVGPYLQLVYMNHGYHFFAPQPGPSTLVTYEATLSDGTTVSGQIPDLNRQVPRLYYHRHFMLTESIAGHDSGDPRIKPMLVRAMARQLCREHGATSIVLTRRTHMLPTMQWCRAGKSLDDPELYEDEPLGRFEWADF